MPPPVPPWAERLMKHTGDLDAAGHDAYTAGGGSISIDALTDVDTTSSPPTFGMALVWNGSLWVPGSVAGGAGSQGPIGPRGLDGDDGEPGPIGPPGAQGSQGAQGSPGPAGASGIVLMDTHDDGQDAMWGPQGVQGPQGPQGTPGTTGSPGVDGAIGPMGYRGLDGADGDDAMWGPQGPQGAPGTPGTTGLQGPSGTSGIVLMDTHDDGQDAMWGPQGVQGIQGVQGVSGPQGIQGPLGGFVLLNPAMPDEGDQYLNLGPPADAKPSPYGMVAIQFAASSAPGTGVLDMAWGFPTNAITTMRLPGVWGWQVVGIMIAVSTAWSAGTLTAQVWNNSTGALVGATAAINSTNTTIASGTVNYNGTQDLAVSQQMRCRLTGSAFTPTANTVTVVVFMAYA